MIDTKCLFIKGITDKYPEELLEKRIETEGNVIACLYKDILLLDDVKINKDMFISKDGRFYFSLANSLRKKRFNNIDEVTILSNCSDSIIDLFNEKGGYDSIEHLVEIINTANFDIYIDQLFRENLLCKMHLDGFNLFKEIKIKGKDIIPIKLFRKMTSEQVLDFYETLISGYEIGQASDILEEEEVYFDDNWIDELEDGEDIGVPFDIAGYDIDNEKINCFPLLSNQTLGLLHKTLTMYGGYSSIGKSTYCVSIIMSLLYRGEKVMIISNEETLSKFKIKFMSWLLAKHNKYFKLTKNKLTSGILTDEDKKQIKIAQKYFNDNYKGKLVYVSISSMNISLIKKKIKDYALKWGCTAYLVDTFKLGEENIDGSRQDLSLVRDSQQLHKLSRKYDLIGMATIQLAEYMKGRLFLDASVLSNSKQVKEVLEGLFLMRGLYEEELDPKSKFFIRPFKLKKVNDKWIEEEYRVDRMAVYRMLFVEKNRNGNNSSDNGVAYLLKFDGSHSIFKEVAQCRPRHGVIQ